MARPKIQIDAEQVTALAETGMKVVEIAAFFGVSHDTISRNYATELAKGKHELKKNLRMAQILAAQQGNSTMLVWLGKQYLGQTDTSIDEYLLEAIKTAGLTKEDLLELIKNKDQITRSTPIRSFHEFCHVSDYPPPFDKQVEMMEFGMQGEDPKLLLGSRGYGKTDYVTIMGTAYEIYKEYVTNQIQSSNLIITKSKERNSAMLREIQNACVKNGVAFDRANATHLRVKGLLGKDHSVSAVTIKTTSLRGRHPKRVIMDDPVTEDDVSEATRLQARRTLNEVMKLTKNVLLIGQPAHQYDLYADVRGEIKTMEVPFGTIGQLDHDLQAQRLAGVSEASISASYHLKVLTEGTTPFNGVKYLPTLPPGDSVAFIDPSEGGDYTAVTILKGYMGGIAAEGYVWKKAWNHCLDDLLPKLQKHNVRKLAFETNCTGNQPLDMLRQLWPALGVVGRRANNNKHSRIMAAGAFAHLIHLSKESDKLYLDHVVKYEYKSKYDDAPDSLASCLEWVGLVRGKQ
jgi:hypothetical protein